MRGGLRRTGLSSVSPACAYTRYNGPGNVLARKSSAGDCVCLLTIAAEAFCATTQTANGISEACSSHCRVLGLVFPTSHSVNGSHNHQLRLDNRSLATHLEHLTSSQLLRCSPMVPLPCCVQLVERRRIGSLTDSTSFLLNMDECVHWVSRARSFMTPRLLHWYLYAPFCSKTSQQIT